MITPAYVDALSELDELAGEQVRKAWFERRDEPGAIDRLRLEIARLRAEGSDPDPQSGLVKTTVRAVVEILRECGVPAARVAIWETGATREMLSIEGAMIEVPEDASADGLVAAVLMARAAGDA